MLEIASKGRETERLDKKVNKTNVRIKFPKLGQTNDVTKKIDIVYR